MIDLSPDINLKRYGTEIAPVYDPGRITCTTLALFSSVTDTLADPVGVQKLRRRLRVKPVFDYTIRDKYFGHVSFIFGSRERLVPYVVKPVIRLLDVFY